MGNLQAEISGSWETYKQGKLTSRNFSGINEKLTSRNFWQLTIDTLQQRNMIAF